MTLPNGAAFVAPVVIFICISYSMTSLAITRFKEIYGYSPWCHESSIAALIGLIVGGAIKFFTGSTVEFDNDVFFYIVLPPIIFSAGLSLKKKMFFRYISLITLFGVIGTIVNFCLITAVAYHATRMFDFRDNLFDRPVNLSWEHAMFLAAVLSGTGVSCGLINARILKSLTYLREHPIHQTVLLLLFAYLAYTIAEGAGVSGILTLFVTAVTQGHYSWHSLSKPAQVATKINAVALSDIAEGFAFSYVGLSMWEYVDDGFHIQFSLFIMLVVIVSRLITILALCSICSCFCKSFHMPIPEQLGFTLGGIVRGCLCWAQILQISEHRMLVTTTLFIVMATSLAGGFVMPVIIPRLGLKAVPHTPFREEENKEITTADLPPLKMPLRSHSRHLSNRALTPLDKGTSRRKLSVYRISSNPDAEDDSYVYGTASHHHGSMDQATRDSANSDGKIVNSASSYRSMEGLDDIHDSQNLDLNTEDSAHINHNDSAGRSGPRHVHGRTRRCSSTSQVFLDRMSTPRNFSSWDSVERSFQKKSSHHRRTSGHPKCRSMGISHSAGHNSNHVKTFLEASRRQAESDLSDSGSEDSRIAHEGGREEEEKDENDSRKETEDFSIKQRDIDDLDDLNDEVSSQDQECAMARHQIVLDEIYGIDSTVAPQGMTLTMPTNENTSFEVSKEEPSLTCTGSGRETGRGREEVERMSGLSPKENKVSNTAIYSKWGDVNKYKSAYYHVRHKDMSSSRSVQRLGPVPEDRVAIAKEKEKEKDRVKGRDTTRSTIKFPTTQDSMYRTHTADTTSSGDGVGSVSKMYKTASAFVSWVHFDEEYLKPLFGGSKREYTSVPDELHSPLK